MTNLPLTTPSGKQIIYYQPQEKASYGVRLIDPYTGQVGQSIDRITWSRMQDPQAREYVNAEFISITNPEIEASRKRSEEKKYEVARLEKQTGVTRIKDDEGFYETPQTYKERVIELSKPKLESPKSQELLVRTVSPENIKGDWQARKRVDVSAMKDYVTGVPYGKTYEPTMTQQTDSKLYYVVTGRIPEKTAKAEWKTFEQMTPEERKIAIPTPMAETSFPFIPLKKGEYIEDTYTGRVIGGFGRIEKGVSKYIPLQPDWIKEERKWYTEHPNSKMSIGGFGRGSISDFFAGMEYKIEKQIKEKPLTTLAIGGAGAGIGAVGVGLSSLGTMAATSIELGGLTLGSLYWVKKYGEFKLAPTLFEKGGVVGGSAIELAAFTGSAKLGGKFMLRQGFVPQPSIIPRLSFETYKVKTIPKEFSKYQGLTKQEIKKGIEFHHTDYSTGKGFKLTKQEHNLIHRLISGKKKVTPSLKKFYEQYKIKVPKEDIPSKVITLYRGIGIIQPSSGKGTALIGFGQGKFFLGSKGFGKLTPPSEGISLSATSPAQMQISKALLKKYPKELDKLAGESGYKEFKLIADITGKTYKTPSKVYTKKFEKPESFKSKEGFEWMMRKLSGIKNLFGFKAGTMEYGSVTAKPQIRKILRTEVGASGDIDTMVYKNQGFTEELAKSSAKTLTKKFKDYAFTTTKEPTLIQTNVGGKSHKVDIHTTYGDTIGEVVFESFYGKPFGQLPKKIGKTTAMQLSEAGLRAASSMSTIRFKGGKTYSAPEAHRLKDISRFFTFQKELTAREGVSGKELKSLEARYPKELLSMSKKAPEIKSIIKMPTYKIIFPASLPSIKSISPLSLTKAKQSPLTYKYKLPSPSQSIKGSPSLYKSISAKPSPSIYKYKSPSPSSSPYTYPSVSPSPSPSPSSSPSPYKYKSTSSSPSPYKYKSTSSSPSPYKYKSTSPSPPPTPKRFPIPRWNFHQTIKPIINKRYFKTKQTYAASIVGIERYKQLGEVRKEPKFAGLGIRPVTEEMVRKQNNFMKAWV